MNLATLEVSKQQAAIAVKAYRDAVRRNRTAEDEQILKGYNQILRGRKLIQLSNVISAGGADEQHRPRLAVIRADIQKCEMYAANNGEVRFNAHWARARSLILKFPADTLPRFAEPKWGVAASAIVPLIPPQHRPAAKISNYHILWEANWQAAPVDPALLQHIGGDLWAVLAVWNLTDLERAVLAGRRSS